MENEAKESIAQRLSLLDDLYFPRKVQPSAAADPSQRKSLLLDLLSTDAAVFLERYGSRLSLEELERFDVLKEDYEINWHLNRLRSLINPTEEQKKSQSAIIKNRRLAYMDMLISEGHYFSEDSMREREPYLHHEMLGKFQDPSSRRMARPGERWSETLLRRCEEAFLVEKIRVEQQRLGIAQRDWVGIERQVVQEEESADEEEEEESEEDESDEEESMEEAIEEEKEEDEEKEVAAFGIMKDSSETIIEVPPKLDICDDEQHVSEEPPTGRGSLSYEEMNDRMDQFTEMMQMKFLSGEDHQYVDYKRIDEDVRLDDRWMKEAIQDAEEKYFDDI